MTYYFKHLIKINKILLLPLMLIGLSASTQADEALSRKVHKQFIDQYILANLEILNVEATNFDDIALDACNEQELGFIRPIFERTVAAWMPLQSFRFDAFEKNNRALRIYFWPNSRGEKQVKKFLLKMDATKITPKYFPNISVAVQGLPIVEWLLFHKDSTLNSADKAIRTYSCQFLKAISLNMKLLSEALITELQPYGKMRLKLLNPSANNADYNTIPEVTLQFFKAIHAMVELVHGQKLSRPIGKEFNNLRPKRFEMWRSGLTKNNLMSNISAIEHAYDIFSPLIIAGHNGQQTNQQVRQEFAAVITQINLLPDDLYHALSSPKAKNTWILARDLIAKLEKLQKTLAIKVTDALGIPLGFNALDGD